MWNLTKPERRVLSRYARKRNQREQADIVKSLHDKGLLVKNEITFDGMSAYWYYLEKHRRRNEARLQHVMYISRRVETLALTEPYGFE